MKSSLICFTLFVFGFFTAIFVTNFSKLISVQSFSIADNHFREVNSEFKVIDDKPNHLFWFLQISDLHISLFKDRNRIIELRDFCYNTVKIINPSVVLATGDLTDGKEADNVGSRQVIEEWKIYSDILSNCQPLQKIKWLDVRGNHDNFDVDGISSPRNFFKKFSKYGMHKSYLESIRGEDGKVYTFIAVDACPEQGLKRPFNFVGLLSQQDISFLESLVTNASSASHLIWFGHYPTSCIMSGINGIRETIGKDSRSVVYLCGHLHTLGGLMPNMYTLQKQGFLELELADWKDNRMFRLAVFDHGMFSFTDVQHGSWPIILVTNPKSLASVTPHEPFHQVVKSTHIRVMVFSMGKVKEVSVRVDNEDWRDCTQSKGPLYVSAWDPGLYQTGPHVIQVSVTDTLGYEKTISHEFSFDGSVSSYNLFARILLMTNISTVFQLLFGLAIVSCVLPLSLCRYLNKNHKDHKMVLPDVKIIILRRWIKKVWIISNIDRFYYPLIIYPLYLTVGPWCIGELIKGHIGVIFAWGTIINHTYLPGAFTYTHGFFQLFLFQWPFILCLAHLVEKRVVRSEPEVSACVEEAVVSTVMALLLASQVYLVYYFYLAYGLMAILIGPFRFCPLLLLIWSWREARIMPSLTIRNAAVAWTSRD